METGTIILIVSFGLPLLIILFILFWLRKDFRKSADRAKEIQQAKYDAVPFNARIVDARQSMMTGTTGHQTVHFELEILAGTPYRASATWFIQTFDMSQFQVGNVISVKADRNDPKKIYPDVKGATYTEGYSV